MGLVCPPFYFFSPRGEVSDRFGPSSYRPLIYVYDTCWKDVAEFILASE